jgi:uncharacterized protein involved in exopolysaccharide biosynthesis
MTRAQEIKILEEFLNSLPRDSYLREYFSEEYQTIKTTILNDGWYEPLRGIQNLRRSREAIEERITELTQTERELNERARQARADCDAAERALAEITQKVGRVWSALR